VAFSPDASLLASASADGTLRLWDSRTGRQQATLTGHTDWVGAVAFSPDASLLASASADGTLRLWNPARRTPCARLRLNDPIRALHWGVGGIAVGSGNSVLVLDLVDKDTRPGSQRPPR
jgi:WD40 repeat protein